MLSVRRIAIALALGLLAGCFGEGPVPTAFDGADDPEEALIRSEIKLPEGFEITIFARNIIRPRSMVLGDEGTVFVGTYFFTKGVTSPVYALRDLDGDGRSDFRWEIRNGFNTPNGLAFKDGTLWIVDEDRVWRIDEVEQNLETPFPRIIYSDLPSRAETDEATNVGHWWRYMAYGSDDKLYITVGTRWSFYVGPHTANDLDDNAVYSTIVRMNPDDTDVEIFADGVRNSMDMAFHPVTGDLWFTDNGPSWPFEHPDTYDIPPDELNRATSAGQHFGFPYVHGRLLDPLIGSLAPPGRSGAPVGVQGP